jgi:hypothetical protein
LGTTTSGEIHTFGNECRQKGERERERKVRDENHEYKQQQK